MFGRSEKDRRTATIRTSRTQPRLGLGTLDLFQNALRAYDRAAGSKGQAWLMESVIRTSRGLVGLPEALEKDDKAILLTIRSRYHAFARGRELPDLQTYADAHALLKTLFF